MTPMERALALAREALGRASPNPAVGAVVVKDGRVVGEGYYRGPGTPHAEVIALRQAGDQARGAALFVTLEPCCHHGQTPPCTGAILQAGLRKVHFSILDPDPRVNGGGRAALESAGVAVLQGPAMTLIATTDASDEVWRQKLREAGAEVLVLPSAGGRVALDELLRRLGERGILSLLVEGGGTLLGSFFDLGLVDKVQAVIAPMIVGGAAAPTAVAGRGAARMAEALRLRDVTVERLGEDILVTGYMGRE